MPFEVMNADDRFSERKPQRACDARPNEKRAGESRALRVRNPVEILESGARLLQHALGEGNDAPYVVARRKLGDHAAEGFVHCNLRVNRVCEEAAGGVVNRKPSLVAGGFDAEDDH